MKKKDKPKVINRRKLLRDAVGGAAAMGGASLLSPIEGAIGQTPNLKPIRADNDNDHLQVEVALQQADVSIELDGKPVDFAGGHVKAVYKNVPQLKPTIHIIDVKGKVRQSFQANQLIYARSPFIFACCCCCCCHTANTKL